MSTKTETRPLQFKGALETAIARTILEMCEADPTSYTPEIADAVRNHPHSHPSSTLVAVIENILWLAESRRWIASGP